MKISIVEHPPTPWAELKAERKSQRVFQRLFVKLLCESPQIHGRALDIGCGRELPEELSDLLEPLKGWDGVDPSPEVQQHPSLGTRWQSTFEGSAVPAGAYDLAFAYYVLEHVKQPRPFFEKLSEVLRPGGVFYGLTPNRTHPFTLLSRGIELVGLKGLARSKVGSDSSSHLLVNDYPAFYRCNSLGAVARAVRGLPFRSLDCWYVPTLLWELYFPRWLRFVPRVYDYCLGSRIPRCMQIVIFRLEKDGAGAAR